MVTDMLPYPFYWVIENKTHSVSNNLHSKEDVWEIIHKSLSHNDLIALYRQYNNPEFYRIRPLHGEAIYCPGELFQSKQCYNHASIIEDMCDFVCNTIGERDRIELQYPCIKILLINIPIKYCISMKEAYEIDKYGQWISQRSNEYNQPDLAVKQSILRLILGEIKDNKIRVWRNEDFIIDLDNCTKY